MNKTLLALYGLKFNPFSPELPTEALHVTPTVEQFCWRIDRPVARSAVAPPRDVAGQSRRVRLFCNDAPRPRIVGLGAASWASCGLAARSISGGLRHGQRNRRLRIIARVLLFKVKRQVSRQIAADLQ